MIRSTRFQPRADRSDVLVYDTEPLTEPLDLCGPVTLDLYAASSAVDTDFTAKLCDVDPGGVSRILCDGIIRARYRDGFSQPSFLEPGVATHFRIGMICGHTFGSGHHLRLEVSSSNFPKYDRNLNHGGSLLRSGAEEAVMATQSIFRGESCLTLPIVALH